MEKEHRARYDDENPDGVEEELQGNPGDGAAGKQADFQKERSLPIFKLRKGSRDVKIF